MRRTFNISDFFFDLVKWIFLIVMTIATIYPIVNTVAVSFNDGLDSVRGGIYLWPRMATLFNYAYVLSKQTLLWAAVITVARTVLITVIQLFFSALLAYVLSRKEFMFRRSVSMLYVMTMYLNAGMIPVYLLYRNLGILNSFSVYILPGLVSAFNMIVIRTYIHGLPDSIVESAQMDGAGHLRIFLQIIMPLCLPVLATVALFIAVYAWNSWFDAMLYNSARSDLSTLQYELMKMMSSTQSSSLTTSQTAGQSAAQVTPKSVRAATTVITALPIVMLYPFLQKYFVTGLVIGGVKE